MEPTYLDVDPPIEEGWDERICGVCGEEIEPVEHESVMHPVDPADPRFVFDSHTWCAVQNGYRLRWS